MAEDLDAQLADATRRFLADEKKGLRIATETGFFGGENRVVYASRLFDWFGSDFGRNDAERLDFLATHGPPAAAAFIRRHRDEIDIEWLPYDWTLNDAPLE